MSEIDVAAIRAEIESELRSKIEKEFTDRQNAAMSVADIAEWRGQGEITVKKVLEGGGVKPITSGHFKLYDRKDVVLAFINKDANILNSYGLLHIAKQNAGMEA